MAKQFIRQLDYYGFPDQNTFSSNDVDIELSDIIKKNKEQDKAIKKIAKKEYATIEALNEINAKNLEQDTEIELCISGISALKDATDDIADEVVSISDGLDAVVSSISQYSDSIAELSGIVEAISGEIITSEISELSGKVEALSAETNDVILTLNALGSDFISYTADTEALFNSYSGWADSNYAHQDNTYTKNEVDSLIVSISGDGATKTWVLDQDYSSNSKVDAFSASTISKLDDHDGKIDTLEGGLDDVKTIVSGKAEVSAVTEISNSLNDKLDKVVFQGYSAATNDWLNGIETSANTIVRMVDGKSDKTYVDGKVADEKQEREDSDAVINGLITGITNTLVIISGHNINQDNSITTITNNLAQEVQDRQYGDLLLIGNSGDSKNGNTIYAAKNFAIDKMNSANAYTDQKMAEAEINANAYTDASINAYRSRLDGLATVTDVINRDNAVKTECFEEINDKYERLNRAISNEASYARTQELLLRDGIARHSSDISTLANRINALTVWNGYDPSAYDDSGNGVVDVMHRQLVDLITQFNQLITTLTDKGILP